MAEPFIPMPSGIHLCFDFTTAGQNWQFCLSARKTSGGAITSGDLTAAAQAGVDWWNNTFKAGIRPGTTLRQVRAVDETSQGAPVGIITVGNAGTSAGGDVPLNAALVVSQRTAKRGRSYRGRAYISGLADNLASEVDFTSTVANLLATWFGTLKTNLVAAGFTMVVATKHHNGVIVTPAELNDVTAFVVDTHVDSQRRRLFGRGT